jgi:hypothetical protein
VQSVDEEYKRKTLLRMERDDHLRRALVALRDAGLDTKLDHILGLPGEPRSAQEEARKLYVEFPPRRVQTFWLTYVPGIDLTRQALADGVLTAEDVRRIERGETRVFRHPHLEARRPPSSEQRGTPPASEADFYRRYDLLFRALPLAPAWLGRRLRAQHVPRLGDAAASAVGFVFDLANALRRLDRETLGFARHYARQSLRQLPELLLGGRLPVRAPRVRPPYDRPVAAPAGGLPRRSLEGGVLAVEAGGP